MKNELRTFWSRIIGFNWKFGLFLILLICIPRFILVLNANATENYQYIGMIMVISAIIPFIFLSKQGRKKAGFTRPSRYKPLIAAFIAGLGFSLLLHYIGQFLYADTYENWYVYIGKSYNIPVGIAGKDKLILFAIMAITGMIFSPIGEEMFFRGIVHSAFSKSIGEKKAAIIDSSAFALIHISHFGLVFINQEWKLYILPTLIWVSGMFIVSLLFFHYRKRTGSILGAIICHAAFNQGMIYCIFYLM